MAKYWGWCKYRYQETPKVNLAAEKEKAFEVLNACPNDEVARECPQCGHSKNKKQLYFIPS